MDASLHFEIVVSLIRIFNNKDINKNNAQLIFNTHNPIYLDGELLRHDQIVMVEKRRNAYGERDIFFSRITITSRRKNIKKLFEWKIWSIATYGFGNCI